MPGPFCVFTASMASGGTFSSSADLQHGWGRIGVIIPSMASGSDVYFQGSEIFHRPNTVSATVGAYHVTSGVTNCIIDLGTYSGRYVRVEMSTATTDTPYTFKFLCSE
jgi:hypothetical protein